jgi:hypothetical protein
MKNLYAKKLFMIAFLVLVVTNLIVLFGVYSNRNGEAESQIILTERELQVPYRINKENSSLSLQILWQSLGEKNSVHGRGYQSPAWLDTQKLKTLGFNIDTISEHEDRKYRYYTSKECFIVLEYNGETYQKALKRAQIDLEEKKEASDKAPQNKQLKSYYSIAQNTLKNRKAYESRLYAIDAGNDDIALREKYPDRSRYIITKGLVYFNYNYQQKKAYGGISNLSIPTIHVPLEFSKILDPIIEKERADMKKTRTYYMAIRHAPYFKAKIAYGKRYEPWIISIEPLKK